MNNRNPPSPPSPQTPNSDHQTMKVAHGRKIMNRVKETHQTATETHAAAQSILEILNPSEEEPSPILEAIQGLTLILRHQQMTLERMEKAVLSIDQRLARLEMQRR